MVVSCFFFLNIGIPSNTGLNQIEDHWRKCYQARPHALTVLVKLFNDMDEVINYIIIFCCSGTDFYNLVISIRATNEIFK